MSEYLSTHNENNYFCPLNKNMVIYKKDVISPKMEILFSVGEKFLSYSALESKIEQYQRSSCVQFYKRSSRTIAAAKSRCPKKTQ